MKIDGGLAFEKGCDIYSLRLYKKNDIKVHNWLRDEKNLHVFCSANVEQGKLKYYPVIQWVGVPSEAIDIPDHNLVDVKYQQALVKGINFALSLLDDEPEE